MSYRFPFFPNEHLSKSKKNGVLCDRRNFDILLKSLIKLQTAKPIALSAQISFQLKKEI